MRVSGARARGTRAVPLVIAQTDVDYRVPILFRPSRTTAVLGLPTSGTVVGRRVRDPRRRDPAAAARVVAVFFDEATQKAAPAPAAHRAALMSELARTS